MLHSGFFSLLLSDNFKGTVLLNLKSKGELAIEHVVEKDLSVVDVVVPEKVEFAGSYGRLSNEIDLVLEGLIYLEGEFFVAKKILKPTA
jgi:helix-turn-helix protein